MRALGVNWLAVVVAAIAIYATGFVIYGLLIPEASWMAMSGITEAEKSVAMSRMAFSPVMPILTAIFMALVFRWAGIATAAKGAQLAVLIALASAIPNAERLAVLDTVTKFPARARCAALPWETLKGALDNPELPIVVG